MEASFFVSVSLFLLGFLFIEKEGQLNSPNPASLVLSLLCFPFKPNHVTYRSTQLSQ